MHTFSIFRIQVILVISLSIFLSNANAASRFMLPQPMPKNGPWFEGWYIRVTDPVQDLSFAVLSASGVLKPIPLKASTSMPGLVAMVLRGPGQPHTESQEYSLNETWPLNLNQYFAWQSPEIGYLTEHELQYRLPSGDEVELTFGPRVPWAKTGGDSGPNGFFTGVQSLPLNWYVDSLGTPTQYQIRIASTGKTYQGTGWAHVEKNWGKSFPDAWMWAQAVSEDNKTHFALAGGPVTLNGVTVKTFVFGYKSSRMNLEFGPHDKITTFMKTTISGCDGKFRLQAVRGNLGVIVTAEADPRSFIGLSSPTPTGFKPNVAQESFATKIKVTVLLNGHVIEKKEFRGAALEFGGDYRCKK
jgi:hypothetical protein